MSEKQGNSLIKNAFILSGAAILSKILGAFYQAFLYQQIGSAGVGIYMKGLYFYSMLLAISASGIPIAVSKMVAEERAAGRKDIAERIFSNSNKILGLLGGAFALLLFVFAPFIANNIYKDPRIIYVLQAMAPAIFIVAIMGSIRGYFQGKENMTPTGVSQIVEQVVRVGFSVAITLFLINSFKEIPVLDIVNGVAFGPFLGAVFSLLILLVYLYFDRKNTVAYKKIVEVDNWQITKRIIIFALPVTLTALLPTLLDVIGGIIIPNELIQLGYSSNLSDQLYGSCGGAVITLTNLVVSVSAAFATSIVPAISSSVGKGEVNEVVRKLKLLIKMIVLINIPAGIFLLVLGQPVLSLIFHDPEAFRILQFSFIMVLFIGLYHNTTGILQGIGKTYTPIISLIIGLIADIILLKLLIQIPSVNILAAPISYTLGFMIAFGINYLVIRINIKHQLELIKWLPKIIVGSIIAVMAGGLIYYITFKSSSLLVSRTWAELIGLIIASLVCGIIYLLFLIISKGLSREEAGSIPKLGGLVDRIYAVLEKK